MSRTTERLERLLLFSTLLFLYTVPLFSYILPVQCRGTRIFVPFFIASSLLSIAYAVLCLCYRGFVDLVSENINPLTEYSTSNCTICMQFKPERAHHCSRCRRCIKKMDHHCHWLGRCINYHNLGHFTRFLFFTFVSTAMLLAYNLVFFINAVFRNTEQISKGVAALVVVTFFVAGLISLVTVSHFLTQMFMILNNITFIETMKKHSFGGARKSPLDSIYNVGWYNNLVDVFGSPLLLFLWMPSGDGLNYSKRIEPESAFINSTYYDDDMYDNV